MLKINLDKALVIACAAAMAFPANSTAQKKAMDHDVYDSWQRVSGVKASDDANVIAWQVDPQEGDGTLYIRSLAQPKGRRNKTGKPVELVVPRGYGASLDPGGHWLFCRIKPQFAKTRQEKIDKKKTEERAKDTLAVVDIRKMVLKKLGTVESFSVGQRATPYIAYKTTWKHYKDSSDKKGSYKSGLVIYNPVTEHADTVLGVDSYAASASGDKIVFTTKKDKKDSTSATSVVLGYYKEGKPVLDTLAKGAESYTRPVFDDDELQLAFTGTTDTNKTGDKRHFMMLTRLDRESLLSSTRCIIEQGYLVPGTDAWTLTGNSSIYFTPDGRRIMTGIAPVRPPKDTTIVDFESAQLDIWNWDAPYTPPQQRTRLTQIMKKTYPATIDLNNPGEIVVLATRPFDSVRLLGCGKTGMAVSRDGGEYVRSSVWDYKNLQDIALVRLSDGSRTPVAKGLDAGRFDVSPEGKYLIWFDNTDLHWYTYHVETGLKVNLTEGTGVKFHDEEDDHPMAPGAYERVPRWLQGDQAVLIVDRYDVWKFAPDGSSATNLTNGVGRQTRNRFTTTDPSTGYISENMRHSGYSRSLNPGGKLYLSLQNEDDKKNGLGQLLLSKPARTLEYFTDTVTFQSVTKAEKSGRFTFMKGNFRNPYDLYFTDNQFKTDTKLTSINPQMAGYRWGNVELFSWKAYDGTPLKGLVFVPEGIKPGEKLPVMIYFYEKYSNELYAFRTPAPSRSTVNIPFFMSRGYLVFVPDIVYKVGHPGESAYNCICSGAEALCEQYPFADKGRMAIQGQSWGGYQAAWLVTRTNMFAAAGAGAPVSNMTSAYGGIRWESGMTRAGQYEHGQSRIGKSLWDEGGLDLYIENSPVFHADKVQTPLLIMHNDNDGAVPWYQGIEYFSNLRRLDKPCWLLAYNREAHNLEERRNSKDLSRRLQQFFDHYLKGAPMPAWMKTGVPTDRKGEYYGFEYAE